MKMIGTGLLTNFASQQGTEIVGCSGQDDTDLEKTLNLVDTLDLPSNSIVITGCNGGNIGQELANYHACWKHSHRQIALISEAGVVMYLAPGRHRIHAAADFKCSILPLGEPCASITTTGLKWNLGTQKNCDFLPSSLMCIPLTPLSSTIGPITSYSRSQMTISSSLEGSLAHRI